MKNIQSIKRNMVWIDGNTLVRVVGEEEERNYLYGNGYQSKLTAFIKERDKKLYLEEQERKRKAFEKKKANYNEPGLCEKS